MRERERGTEIVREREREKAREMVREIVRERLRERERERGGSLVMLEVGHCPRILETRSRVVHTAQGSHLFC